MRRAAQRDWFNFIEYNRRYNWKLLEVHLENPFWNSIDETPDVVIDILEPNVIIFTRHMWLMHAARSRADSDEIGMGNAH